MNGTATPRWLVVVSPSSATLFNYLSESFRSISTVEIICERRVGERRKSGKPPTDNRRRAERRVGAGIQRFSFLGYTLIRRAEIPTAVAPSPRMLLSAGLRLRNLDAAARGQKPLGP